MIDYPLANEDYLKALRKLLEIHHQSKPEKLTRFHQCKNECIGRIEYDYDPTLKLTCEQIVEYISDEHLLSLAPYLLEYNEALVRLKREEKRGI